MTQRFRLDMRYVGAAYGGFQVQPTGTSIQQLIEQAIARLTSEQARIVPSGRTDKGVHALHQVAHVKVSTDRAIKRLNAPEAAYQLSSMLPDDIVITSLQPVESTFHARRSVVQKTYLYVVHNHRQRDPFLNPLTWHVSAPLDLAKMQHAANDLLGEHDFTAFCATDATVKHKRRTILSADMTRSNLHPVLPHLSVEHLIAMRFTANGFLKQMVRRFAGTLVRIGQGTLAPDVMQQALVTGNPALIGPTAPACGLYLERVEY